MSVSIGDAQWLLEEEVKKLRESNLRLWDTIGAMQLRLADLEHELEITNSLDSERKDRGQE